MNNKNNTNEHTKNAARGIILNPPGSDTTEDIFDGDGGDTNNNNLLSVADRNSAEEINIATCICVDISASTPFKLFKFTTSTQDIYSIYTLGNFDTVGYLYDSNGNLITIVDEYEPGSNPNFHIIRTLAAESTYYIKVYSRSNQSGNYILKITPGRVVSAVTITPTEITLEEGVTYELPITPNYTYIGSNGEQQIPELSIAVHPSVASEQRVSWVSSNADILQINTYSHDNQEYQTVTVIGSGTAHLYAWDHKKDGSPDMCTVTTVTPYEIMLKNSGGFSHDAVKLILKVYDKIDELFANETIIQKAWKCARLLSEFCYDSYSQYFFELVQINKYDDMAGTVTNPGDIKSYFIDTLEYTDEEYVLLKKALENNNRDAYKNNQIDFAHMQYSLAARLAYTLEIDGLMSNIGAGTETGNSKLYTNEEISYLGGWLGDAVLKDNGKTVLKNDDYMADLDAENIYRLIIQGNSWIDATNIYYSALNSTNTRAHIFLSYIPYNTVKHMICRELFNDEEHNYEELNPNCSDTYNFLKSLENYNSEIEYYA